MHSIKQFAKSLNCSETHVRRLIAEGEIEYIKCGRLIRIPQQSIDAYFKKVTVPVTNVTDIKAQATKLLKKAKA